MRITRSLEILESLGRRGIQLRIVLKNPSPRTVAPAAGASAGGILVATSAAMVEGFDFPVVTDLVLYDLPRGKIGLQQVLGRFDRFGRQHRLNVHVLRPCNVGDAFTPESLGLLQELLDSCHKGQPQQ
jgi:hypothetical protein